MSVSNDVNRRRLLSGFSLLGLAILFLLNLSSGLMIRTETIERIAAVGFAMPLLMACLVGSVFGITQILRRHADVAGLVGGVLVLMGWAAGIRILALRQLEAALKAGTGGAAPDSLDRVFRAAPILWQSIVPSGILFPIGAVILGMAIALKGPIPRWIGLVLIAGGVLFPMGRIARIAWAFHAADVALAAAFGLLAWQVLARPHVWTGESAARSEVTAAPPKTIFAVLAFLVIALPAHPQGPPFLSGLELPSKVAFTRQHNLVVAESGTEANNTGRISLVDRATKARRTFIDGLPSGLSRAEEPPTPSGPSGLAVQDRTIYVTIGSGDAVLPGPAPGTEQPNPSIASPILASLLSLQSSVPLDVAAGGFALTPADHTTLKAGEALTLHNDAGEELVVRLVADFPDYTAEPRPDFAANVRAGNPFGVAVRGQALYVVDASQNLVRRVDANSGETTTLATIGKVQNPTPVGPPVIDAVPDSIHLRGDDLVVTTLTGFPFPAGRASVLKIGANGATETLVSGLTSAIDVAPLGNGAADPLLVLEFSTNMLQRAPGRLRLVTPSGSSTTIAEGLPTPTSMAVDATTGEVLITHIFPGFITRIDASALLPDAPPSAIVPVIASVPGAFGSQFTTTMQIANPYPFAISGRLVVHPAGASASSSDPSMPYSLAPFATGTIDDPIANGSGSVDVLAGVGSSPVVITTISDATSMQRVQIPSVDPSDAIERGERCALITPADPSRERFNIGIRTLGSGADLVIRLHDGTGAVVTEKRRAFGADFFLQFSFADLLGVPLAANQSITFDVEQGSAIVYGSAIDNVSGAMSFHLARPVSD